MSAAELEAIVDDAALGSDELTACAGITYRELDHWTRRGFLRPVDPEPGTGYSRKWPESELEIAYRMGLLRHAGLPLAFAASMARDSWPSGWLTQEIVVIVIDAEESP